MPVANGWLFSMSQNITADKVKSLFKQINEEYGIKLKLNNSSHFNLILKAASNNQDILSDIIAHIKQLGFGINLGSLVIAIAQNNNSLSLSEAVTYVKEAIKTDAVEFTNMSQDDLNNLTFIISSNDYVHNQINMNAALSELNCNGFTQWHDSFNGNNDLLTAVLQRLDNNFTSLQNVLNAFNTIQENAKFDLTKDTTMNVIFNKKYLELKKDAILEFIQSLQKFDNAQKIDFTEVGIKILDHWGIGNADGCNTTELLKILHDNAQIDVLKIVNGTSLIEKLLPKMGSDNYYSCLEFLHNNFGINVNTKIGADEKHILYYLFQWSQHHKLFSVLEILVGCIENALDSEIDWSLKDKNGHTIFEDIVPLFTTRHNRITPNLEYLLKYVKHELLQNIDIHGNNLPLLLAKNGLIQNALDIAQKKNTKDEFIFHVNYQNTAQERLIDIVAKNGDYRCIEMLRNLGSVEPKDGFVLTAGIEPLDIQALDSAPANKVNVVKMLTLLDTKYPLTPIEIMQTIHQFKQLNLVTERNIHAEWGNDGQFVAQDLIGAIDALSKMKDVGGGLPCHWSFQKVLAQLIKVVDQDEASVIKLISTIAALKMCNLGKLINLIGCMQDLILEVKIVKYQDKEMSEFKGMMDEFMTKIRTAFDKNEDDAAKAVTQFFYTTKQPEEWSHEMLKVRGVFNDVFAQFVKQHYNTQIVESYHIKSGLESIIIKTLKEKKNVDESAQCIKNLINHGTHVIAEKILDELQDAIMNNKLTEHLTFDKMMLDEDRCYGNFHNIRHANMILRKCYAILKSDQNEPTRATKFLKIVSEYDFNDNAITNVIKQELLELEQLQYGIISTVLDDILAQVSEQSHDSTELAHLSGVCDLHDQNHQ